MRFFWTLLLTFAITVSAYASVAQLRTCCADEDCGIVQCVDMGCLPAAHPMLPQPALATPGRNLVRAVPEERKMSLPSHPEKIWTPPD